MRVEVGENTGEELVIRLLPGVVRGGTSTIRRGKGQLASGATLLVAVKTIRHPDDHIALECLSREIAVARTARHRFIVPYIGTVDLQDGLGIVLPYMENGNMVQYLRANPDANRRLLVLQVAAAVCYLHFTLKIVHGDLKCENVLVSDGGDALLTDFGLSTTIDKPSSEETTGRDIRACNTLRFSAPELLLDDARSTSNRVRSKTQETDVYAFGMFTLQAFTGEPPWPDYNQYQVVVAVLSTKLTHPRPGGEVTLLGLDDWLWELCLRCWTRDPVNRPDMREIWRNLGDAPQGLVSDEALPLAMQHVSLLPP